MPPRDKDRSALGYAGAILLSALGHAAFFFLVLFALPRWFEAPSTPPPVYSVKIVDSLPAGDLGSHLPKLSGHKQSRTRQSSEPSKPTQLAQENSSPHQVEAPNEDKNAFSLNITASPIATPAPTDTPTATPEATPEPTPEPAATATPVPTAKARPRARRATPRPTPAVRIVQHRPPPSVPSRRMREKGKPVPPPKFVAKFAVAKAPPAASVKQQLAELKKQLLAEHLKEMSKHPAAAEEEEPDEGEENAPETPSTNGNEAEGGPVTANVASAGHGYGIGPGTGSLGILKDRDFLLYYQAVQARIKEAWSFSGGSNELTATVDFAIAPDGRLTGLKVARSSNNSSFDESVMRAIRRAAPFPAPPEKYRDEFAQGIEAVFKLGELNS